MAKRVVVFEKPDAAPTVVVRRKRDARDREEKPAVKGVRVEKAPATPGGQTTKADAQKPVPQGEAFKAPAPKAPSQGRREVMFTPPRVIVKGEQPDKTSKAPRPHKQAKTPKKVKSVPSEAFKEAYLEELGKTLGAARAMLTDAACENKEYYQDKSAFLEKLADYFDNGAQSEFAALDEPFFWHEFFVISNIIDKKKPDNCGKARWNKLANEIIKVLLEFYNAVRARRDKYVLKRYPKWESDVVFNFCGAMLYLKKSMAETENAAELEQLLERYETLSAESSIGERVLRMAGKLHRLKARAGFVGWKFWNNPETVEYVYNLLPETEKELDKKEKGGSGTEKLSS